VTRGVPEAKRAKSMPTLATHFEKSFETDLERIRQSISQMGELGERALRKCLKAFQERNRQLAYIVILGDRRIDEMERQLDKLCLEFLVRQQPVAGPLRFAYSTIRVNLELERIGDYAESIARQILKIIGMRAEIPYGRFEEIANLAIPMLHDAVEAFVNQDADLATRTMTVEETVDVLRNSINAELFRLRQEERIPLEALTPLVTIARRFERVSDQAKNICQEVIYCTTGEYMRHKGEEIFRVLFVDEHDSCRAQIAAAVGNSFKKPDFIWASAGVDPKPIDPRTIALLKEKGIDISKESPKHVKNVAYLEQYHVLVGLAKDVQKVLPPPPRKTVYLDWSLPNPSETRGTEQEIRAAYENSFQYISTHVIELLRALEGTESNEQI
jgi:phosphate transport system protein